MVPDPLQNRRRTKIVCTLGPSSSSFDQMQDLANAGMNVARVNVSHGSREEHLATIELLRKLNLDVHLTVAILIDTKGAEIRTGVVRDPLEVAAGEHVLFSPDPTVSSDLQVVEVNYAGFAKDVRETETILVDNGEMSFDIVDIRDDETVVAAAKQDGIIGSRRHINLPGADIDLPSITEQDWSDIAFAAEQNVDFIALSFIRTGDEVRDVRNFLCGKGCNTKIITKVETAQAVENISEIVEQSDGIMVARGDLGAEVPFEVLPVIQNSVIQRCRNAGKPVIVATHMLESMKDHPIPTRAEVTDVAYAAYAGTDATMLSGETATGRHPPVAVEAMDRILRSTEGHMSRFSREAAAIHDERDAHAQAAVQLAESTNADAIIVFTKTGRTAEDVSRMRSNVPIIACTPEESTQRQMALLFGVHPLQIELSTPEQSIERALEEAKIKGLLADGQSVVLVSDVQAKDAIVSSVQTRTV